MVYTDSVLAFAHSNAEKLLDVIPLEEIISIQDCDGVGSADTDEDSGRVLLKIALAVSRTKHMCPCPFHQNDSPVNEIRRTAMPTGFSPES